MIHVDLTGLHSSTTRLFSYFGVALSACLPLTAQPEVPVKWTAMSTTAMGITGDIETTKNELIIQNHRLRLSVAKKLQGEELEDTSDLLNATRNSSTRGELYRTYFPGRTRLQGTNTLCGNAPTQWVVIVHTIDRDNRTNLDLAFFSGNQQPDLKPAAIRISKNLCGTFWYQQ
jgi:hypothetical protein